MFKVCKHSPPSEWKAFGHDVENWNGLLGAQMRGWIGFHAFVRDGGVRRALFCVTGRVIGGMLGKVHKVKCCDAIFGT